MMNAENDEKMLAAIDDLAGVARGGGGTLHPDLANQQQQQQQAGNKVVAPEPGPGVADPNYPPSDGAITR